MMPESLASKLRILRAHYGYTLAEASKITGVDRGTLSNLERGIHAPYTPTLAKIAKGYGVPVEELLEEPVLAPGKDEAPHESGQPDHVESILDIVEEVVFHQRWQARQAQARTEESDRAQAYFIPHDVEGEAILRKRHTDELAQACIHLEHFRQELIEKLQAKNVELVHL